MDGEKSRGAPLLNALGRLLKSIVEWLPLLPTMLRGDSEWKDDLKRLYEKTSEQFREKTEETRKTVRLRMAILDIEHHLNRLYPDIGKLACDLWKRGEVPLLNNPELRSKVELVWEYLERRDSLKVELQSVLDERSKPRSG
jgi:hypothetical protein